MNDQQTNIKPAEVETANSSGRYLQAQVSSGGKSYYQKNRIQIIERERIRKGQTKLSDYKCIDCGKQFIAGSGIQKRCEKCRSIYKAVSYTHLTLPTKRIV